MFTFYRDKEYDRQHGSVDNDLLDRKEELDDKAEALLSIMEEDERMTAERFEDWSNELEHFIYMDLSIYEYWQAELEVDDFDATLDAIAQEYAEFVS